MDFLFSSNDNYARHLGVALYSLLANNANNQLIRCFIVDNDISSDNLLKLQQIVSSFTNAEVLFVPFDKWSNNLHLDMPWPISISCYARLFVGDILPKDSNRVIYLDCDMLVNGDLSELWNIDLGDSIVGAVQDQVPASVKNAVGLDAFDRYFNSGMLIIDLKKWREMNIGEKCLKFIDLHHGNVIHHDQGVLNGILQKLWYRLPLKYNVMTIHYIISIDGIQKYFRDKSSFYEENEIVEAKRSPIILHFTPSFTTHPWEQNCKHPLSFLYMETLNKTPWSGFPLVKDKNPWYVKLLNWYYRNIL